MHREETWQDYQTRVNRVVAFINNNLNEKLDIEQLASISNFSPFHFHRIISAYLNEPVGAYIVKTRLDTAAKLIRYSSEPMNEIAFKVGYDSQTSFNKAFKKRYLVTPMEFRTNEVESNPEEIINYTQDMTTFTVKPKIKNVKARNVVFLSSVGDYSGEQTDVTWSRLFDFMKKNRLFSWRMEFIGIGHDNPDITESDKCRYDACITINKRDFKPEGDFKFKIIVGGKFAVFRYKGPYSRLGEIYRAVFKNWLPGSGYELRNVPVFEKYLNNPDNTKPEKLLTEIFVPIN